MPFIALKNEINMHYEYYRGGSAVNDLDCAKPTIVLLHAEFSNSESWSMVLQDPRLYNTYNFVTFDRKWHGRSTGPVIQGYDYEKQGLDILEAMMRRSSPEKLRLPPAHFVAESHAGSRAAIHLALRRPSRCRSLMLVSPGVFDEEDEETQVAMAELMGMMRETNLRHEAGERNVVYPPELLGAYVGYYFSDAQTQTRPETVDRERDIFGSFAARPWAVNEEIMTNYLGKRAITNLGEIRCPVMLVEGSRNNTYDASAANWADAFTGSSRVEALTLHGAPIRGAATYPLLVTRFLCGWMAKNAAKA